MSAQNQNQSKPSPMSPGGAPTPPLDYASALAQLAESQTLIAKLLANQARVLPKRRKTMREFLKQNPRKYLVRPVYQNGREVDPSGLSDETIKRIDTLASGIYGNGLLQVVRLSAGKDSRIHLMYSNKSIEQRMAFYIQYPSLTSLVNQVLAEMTAKGVHPVTEAAPPPLVEQSPEDEDENL